MKFKRRHGELEQGCVLSESYTATDALPRYSQLVANHCCWLACLLLETPFVTRDVFCSENLFVNQFVCDERHLWTKVPLYRFTIFNIYCSYKSHLSYRMSESVKILSGPIWIVLWFGEGFFYVSRLVIKGLNSRVVESSLKYCQFCGQQKLWNICYNCYLQQLLLSQNTPVNLKVNEGTEKQRN
jgi:hypothetical protein